MSKPFDMELFLQGVLTGSHATRQRHIRQAKTMQAAIQKRFGRDNPWRWQLKHYRWFEQQYLKDRSASTRYYYQLTVRIIQSRSDKPARRT
ncbi:hypothetical protein [Pseudomonas sp. LRF_L74]|uniref:hypothetical protein n=1 Tax=Pseudomonas sp. LRF_L74 TaxID=3369422 RepID=UPI003F6378DF